MVHFLSALYPLAIGFATPLVPALLQWRTAQGKEDPLRRTERTGHSTRSRPEGPLLWIHAASVGESISALALIDRLLQKNAALHILVTSGTVTSANLLAHKLPARAIHQYIPLDVPRYARRFLDHWTPDAALWLESELWPNLLSELKKRNIPAARINARLTAKSEHGWRWVKSWFCQINSAFQVILAIGPADAQRFNALGVPNVQQAGNLKLTAPPPAADEKASATLQAKIGVRPVWMFASTHAGEEELALRVHTTLAPKYPDLLTLIVPRHIARADDIINILGDATPRRSKGEWPQPDRPFYLGDSMGEMGLYYRAAPIVCVGGSFTPKGGHSPVEPAQCGAAVVIGPDTRKCEDLVDALVPAGALIKVRSEAELARTIDRLLSDIVLRDRMRTAALSATRQSDIILEQTLAALSPILTAAGVQAT